MREIHPHDDIYKGDLVLVNSENEYRFPENDTETVAIYSHKNHDYNVKDMVTSLDDTVIRKLNLMMSAFLKETDRKDSNIMVIDGFRTYEQQEKIYQSGDSIFRPGFSDYHTSRTFDLAIFENMEGDSYYFKASGEYRWFRKNASKYGFIIRFPKGKDDITGEEYRYRTYRYVGVPHAEYIYKNSLCMEEYIQLLKSHTKDDPLLFEDDNYKYKIYYVPCAKRGATAVLVPKEGEYTVSGNNSDGFIVTVKDKL